MGATKQIEHDRVCKAYVQMARNAKYRPQAPSDGLGSILLSKEELEDRQRLSNEASDYADRFFKEEDTLQFHIGCSDYETNRALVYTIEAARLLCAGGPSRLRALKLLEMAVEDVKQAAPYTGP